MLCQIHLSFVVFGGSYKGVFSSLETKGVCSHHRIQARGQSLLLVTPYGYLRHELSSRGWGQARNLSYYGRGSRSTEEGLCERSPSAGDSPCTVPQGYCRARIILLPIFTSSVLPTTANGRWAWNRGKQALRTPEERHQVPHDATAAHLQAFGCSLCHVTHCVSIDRHPVSSRAPQPYRDKRPSSCLPAPEFMRTDNNGMV